MLKKLSEAENIQILAGYDFLDLCLLGETGTGKTHAAEQIHNLSPRRDKPFVSVNCAELSRSLVESELFGYEKGAFTGAMQSKVGKFEAASGGTLFLDEIGELDKETQAKLLKAVEEKRITRVGSIVPRDVDVRVIYATHRDPLAFREDLRYRVAAHIIKLKPLRERPEEIMPLARLFINDFIRKSRRSVAASEEALQLLKRAKWCGNVRELRSFIQKACLDALFLADWQKSPGVEDKPTAELTAELLIARLRQSDAYAEMAQSPIEKTEPISADYKQEIKDYDRHLIKMTLEKNKRNISRTAVELGLSRYGLIKKIKRYGIIVE